MLHLSQPHLSSSLLSLAALAISLFLSAPVVAQSVAEQKPANASANQVDDPAVANRNGKPELLWAFLSSGKSLEDVDPEQVDALQNSHLENLKRLAEQGKLLSAGTVSDPEETLQGIALFAPGGERLNDLFQDDELIQGGYQKIQATRMRLEHGVINTGKHGRIGMQEYKMVVIEKTNATASHDVQAVTADSRKAIEAMYRDKDLRLAVRLGKNAAGRHLVLVLDKPEDESQLITRLQEIPAVKHGIWKPKIMPVFFGKGTLDPS